MRTIQDVIKDLHEQYEKTKREEEEQEKKHAHDYCYCCEECEKRIIREFLEKQKKHIEIGIDNSQGKARECYKNILHWIKLNLMEGEE